MTAAERRARSIKRLGLLACLAFASAFAFAGGVWRVGAETMLEAIEQFAVAPPDGVVISYRADPVEGFPLRLRAPLREVKLLHDLGGRYDTERLVVETALWRPGVLKFRPLSDQTILIGARMSVVSLRRADFSVSENCAISPCAQATIKRAQIAMPWLSKGAVISVDRARMSAADAEASDGLRVEFDIKGVSAEAADNPMFERIIGSATLGGATVSAPYGRIDLASVEFQAGEAKMVASGDVGLDASGYLEGRILVALDKPFDLAARVQQAAIFEPDQIDAISTALALAALASGGAVEADILFTGGGAFIEGRRVAELGCIACDMLKSP